MIRMKVVHLNTSVNRSSAPFRLHEALCRTGVESKILVLNEGEGLEGVAKVEKSFFYKCKRKLYAVLRKEKEKKYDVIEYMPFTMFPVGMDVSRLQAVKEADVVFLHWICGDYMSPKTISRLLDTGKIVFWACHDNFPFTGGCHVRLGCDRYEKKCGCCPQLRSDKEMDESAKLLEEKKQLLQRPNLYVTAPSSWMDGNVGKSTVLGGQRHFILPNAIDTKLFRPYCKNAVRAELGMEENTFLLLVGLKANEKIPYNGTEYLWEILDKLYVGCQDGQWNGRKIEIAVFGVESVARMEEKCKFPIRNLGYIRESDKLARIYSAADLYLITSLEDSFNQTAAECMACETPVVAFKNGGIEDIIDHRENGYLAEYKNTEDMVKGILQNWQQENGEKAREKIVRCFSYEKISSKFLQIVKEVSEDGK